MLVSWWICHFGLFVFICKQLYDGPARLEMEKKDSNRADPNLSIIPRWLNMAQHEERHPEDIKGTSSDEWRANNEGGTVSLRQKWS